MKPFIQVLVLVSSTLEEVILSVELRTTLLRNILRMICDLKLHSWLEAYLNRIWKIKLWFPAQYC